MLYHFELQMAGVILLGAMLACGVFLYIRRRRDRLLREAAESRLLRGDGDDSAATADGDSNGSGMEPKDRGSADNQGSGNP